MFVTVYRRDHVPFGRVQRIDNTDKYEEIQEKDKPVARPNSHHRTAEQTQRRRPRNDQLPRRHLRQMADLRLRTQHRAGVGQTRPLREIPVPRRAKAEERTPRNVRGREKHTEEKVQILENVTMKWPSQC